MKTKGVQAAPPPERQQSAPVQARATTRKPAPQAAPASEPPKPRPPEPGKGQRFDAAM